MTGREVEVSTEATRAARLGVADHLSRLATRYEAAEAEARARDAYTVGPGADYEADRHAEARREVAAWREACEAAEAALDALALVERRGREAAEAAAVVTARVRAEAETERLAAFARGEVTR